MMIRFIFGKKDKKNYMRRKKILHLITGLEIGGTEMMLLKTLPDMHNDDDFDNRVCCIIGHGPMGEKLETAGVPVYYLNLKNIFDLGLIWRFRKIINEFQPEILVTYLIHADLFGRIFGRIFGIKKIICSQRGSLLQWEFLRFLDRFTKFLVTKYIVQTEVAKIKLSKKLHLPLEKFEVIPNSIDISEFEFELDKDAKKKELDINMENLNIVCVSKLRQGKGHLYLMEAFENVFENNKNINLLIVGDGKEKDNLLRQIEKYESKNNIYFLGNRNDVKEILKISDIFVLPTLAEGMSNAIMEAMASGLPIITTDILENKELIENNKTGILIPVKNSATLSQAIEDLLYNKNKKETLGNNAKKETQKDFNINIATSKIIQLLKKL